ncbi:DNA-binding protein [Candidatus Kaiserbacteria bacterium]|nr:DNA-binding protein [Candidatus Kaiserbacteria bacterium]USN92195.1 MAG: DNA-binding protein [Candidatus Nomurabacteria bacterium]
MKIIHEDGNFKTLSFARGEEIMSGLKTYFTDNKIHAAHITGLGAADKVDLAYYNLDSKEYERHKIDEAVEIIGINGNAGIKEDGEVVVHIHGTFGRKDLSVFGGHVFSMRVSGAGEIHLRVFAGVINRAYDEETGLTLMCDVPVSL